MDRFIQNKRSQISKVKEKIQFNLRFLRHPTQVGSVLPSSTQLAKKIIDKIPSFSGAEDLSHRYLEIGAGTGTFTEHIIQKILPMDTLDVVEFDPLFCQILNKKFMHLPNVSIHEASILDYEAESYDVLISGLPLNAFKADLVEGVLKKYASLTKIGGYVSYFEYIGLARIKRRLLLGKSRHDFISTLELIQTFARDYCEEIDYAWLNVLPARVCHCKILPS